MAKGDQNWRVWDGKNDYGDILYQRATGQLPEMESAKAAALLLKAIIQPKDTVIDVGCGAGHYLRSLRRELDVPFEYTGIDATAGYVALAKQAWAGDAHARFETGDIFDLPFADNTFDLVISCNLLLHLPSIRVPFRELVRVARRNVLVRTLIGERSFQIKEVHGATYHPEKIFDHDPADEFDNEQPRNFNYYNIYSQSYVSHLLGGNPAVREFRILPDRNFDPQALLADANRHHASNNATRIMDEWQVNGCILQPWHFVVVDKILPS
jgi:SAM-dependent methyltransferase